MLKPYVHNWQQHQVDQQGGRAWRMMEELPYLVLVENYGMGLQSSPRIFPYVAIALCGCTSAKHKKAVAALLCRVSYEHFRKYHICSKIHI